MVNSYSEYYVVLYSYSEMIPCSIRAWIKSLHRLFICCSCFLVFKYWTKCFNNCNFDFLFLLNLEFLPFWRWTCFCLMDNRFSWKANSVWFFFKYSSQFSKWPKWKTICSQPELLLQEIFIAKRVLVGWASFFMFKVLR